MFKKDFPIFSQYTNLVYLDSASSAQKPQAVIDALQMCTGQQYANIHRGVYDLSMNASSMYTHSKQKIAEYIGADSHHEIVYTYNATYAINLIARSLIKTGILKKGDTVLLSKAEHHANIVPWQILKEEYGVCIEWGELHEDGTLDYKDLSEKIPNATLVALTGATNVSGEILDIAKVCNMLDTCKNRPLFLMDGTQRFPHMGTNVKEANIDFFVATGHKIMTDTGLGFFYASKDMLKQLQPAFCGGGAISEVTLDGYSVAGIPMRHEPGTPHIIGAASMLAALEYIESLGGYATIEAHEQALTKHALERIKKLPPSVRLLGSLECQNRLGVFSFACTSEALHPLDIAEALADKQICVRVGHHCAEPFHTACGVRASLRASAYLYNSKKDFDIFFDAFERILHDHASSV